jgi:hypothetical protein
MLDIPSISAIVAAIGVIIGVVFTVLELRNLVQSRQTDLILRLQTAWRSRALRESYVRVMNMKFKDYDEFAKKYPLYSEIGLPEYRAVSEIGSFFDGIGILLHRKLIDIEMVDELFGNSIKATWEKLKPGIEGRRREVNPSLRRWFEYLYNETKKREQQLRQKGVKYG